MSGYGYLFRQRCFFAAQAFYLACSLGILPFHAVVLVGKSLVYAVQRVYLEHITAQYGAYCSQFLFQTGYLAGVCAFHVFQFLKQLLRAQLFLRELCHDGIVVDLSLHFAVLAGELFILVFHLFLVKIGQFLHLFVHLFLVDEAVCQESYSG